MNECRSKGRRVRVVTRKWSMEEEQEILHYIKRYLDNLQLPEEGPVRTTPISSTVFIHTFAERKNKMQAFPLLQKMSACYFFEKMSSAVKFDVISPSQMRNKVRNLQQKYLKAVELRQQMENILDNDTMLSMIKFAPIIQHSI